MEIERKHLLANPTVWEDFKKCRDIDGLHSWAATHGVNVRRYPKLLFARLCHAGQPLPVLLHALEDAALGTPGNLNFLLDWQLRKPKGTGRRTRRLPERIDFNNMALLQQWMKGQLYLGLKSEEDIQVFLRFVSRVGDATSDKSLRDNFITSFEGLQSSSVFGFKDLGTETQHRILEFIARGSVTRQLLELGFSFIKAMPRLGLEGTDQRIAAFIASVVHAHASLREHEKPGTPSLEVVPTILETIWQLPRKLACSVILITTKALINDHLCKPAIEVATMQLPDTWLSALAKNRNIRRKLYLKGKIENFLGAQKAEVAVPYLRQLDERQRARFILRYWVRPRPRFRRHRAWYLFPGFLSAKGKHSPRITMLQSVDESAQGSTQPLDVHIRQVFKTLQMLRLSESIAEIIKQARKLDAIIDINESDVVYIIREHLGEHLQLAERFFQFYPQLRLEKCPELAEQMILSPENNPDAALRYLLRKGSRYFVHRDQFSRKQVTQPRIQLLGRMAIAYSMALHLSPRQAFRFIHDCYTLHTRERLGPITVAVARAFTRAGVIRPLQAGHWVSSTKFRWILSVIRSTEGTDVAHRVDETTYKWRGTNVR